MNNIIEEWKKNRQFKLVGALILFFIAAALFITMMKPSITGFVTYENSSYLEWNKSYTITSEDSVSLPDDIKSLLVSGKLVGDGQAKVYLETSSQKILIIDTANLDNHESTNLITGNVVDELNSTQEIAPSEPENISIIENISAVENISTNATAIVNLTENVTENITEAITENISAVNESESTLIENITKQSIKFELYCKDSCLMFGLKGPYKLIIETTGDMNISIDNITYTYTTTYEEESITNSTVTNVTEINLTETIVNLTENVTENITLNITENVSFVANFSKIAPEILAKLLNNEDVRVIIKSVEPLDTVQVIDDTAKSKINILSSHKKNRQINKKSVTKEFSKIKGLDVSKMINKTFISNLTNLVEVKQDIDGVQSVIVNMSTLEELSSLDSVDTIVIDKPFSLLTQESMNITGITKVHQENYSGLGKKICIIDTGVDYDALGLVLNSTIYGVNILLNNYNPMDDNGHGTQVASIIYTVAPNSVIYAAKVMDSSGIGYESDVLAGLQYCIDNNVDIISFSIGSGLSAGYCDDDLIANKSNYAVDKGIYVVAATGNDGSLTYIRAPSCGSKVTRVAASTKSDTVASISNMNNMIDLLAPGQDISLTNLGGVNTVVSGTSFATPFVTGSAALILENRSTSQYSISPYQLTYLFRSTSDIINFNGITRNRLNTYNALINNITNEPFNYSMMFNQTNVTQENFSILASTPYVNPGVVINTGPGTMTWTNPQYANESDTFRANASIAANSNTTRLNATAFGFNIPASRIDGIELQVRRNSSGGTTTDREIYLMKNYIIATANMNTSTAWSNAGERNDTYGNSTNTWGVVWNPADINSVGFGAIVRAKTTTARVVNVNAIWIRVYYTLLDDNISVTANQSRYYLGQNANVSGYYLWNNGSGIGSSNITVSFINTSHIIVYQVNVTTNDSGFYSANYTLPITADEGSWDVNVSGIFNATYNASNTTSFMAGLNPLVHLVSPVNITNATNLNVTFSCNITDNNQIQNLTLFVWNATNAAVVLKNASNLGGTTNSSSWNNSLPGDGNYSWNCLGFDTSGFSVWSNEYNYSIILDDTPPNINYAPNTDSNNSVWARSNIIVNVTATDLRLANITIYLYNVNMTKINSTYSVSSPDFANYTALPDGTYYFNATSYDTFGNVNFTPIRNMTLDASLPVVHLVSPVNITNATNLNVTFSCNITDGYLIKNLTLYVWNATNAAVVLKNASNLGGTTNSSLWNNSLPGDGNYSWNCLGVDFGGSAVWSNEYNYSIILDDTPPNINYAPNTDSNNSVWARSNIIVNVTATDLRLANITIYLYNVNMTKINSTYSVSSPDFANYTALPDGTYYFNATSYDTFGNVNFTVIRNVSIDTTPPTIHLVNPINQSNTTSNNVSFSCNITDNYLIRNISVYVWNSSASLVNVSNRTLGGVYNSTSWNINLPTYGNYSWSCLGVDYVNLSSWAYEKNYTIEYWDNRTVTTNSSRISPTPTAYVGGDLLGYCNGSSATTNVSYYYTWFLNGVINTSGYVAKNYTPNYEYDIANISGTSLLDGQNWTFSCMATLYYKNGTWINSTTTTVSGCGDYSTPNQVITLSRDISINGSTCISIIADNVTLDCAGYTISGNSTTGTVGVGSDSMNTVVKNCTVRAFDDVLLLTGYDSLATNNNLLNGTVDLAGYNNTVENSFMNNTNLISNWGPENNTIQNNNIYVMSGGSIIFISNSNGHKVINNTIITLNDTIYTTGIAADSNNTLIENNTIFILNGAGIEFGQAYGGFNNTIKGNSISVYSNFACLSLDLVNSFIKNNTLNCTYTATHLDAFATSRNNQIYYNNFIGLSKYIVNHNATNYFNTSVAGIPQGNYYDGINSIEILDSNDDGWGDAGLAYPLNNNSLSVDWEDLGVDYGPATSRKPVKISFVLPTPDNNTASTNTSYTFNVSLNATPLNNFVWNWNGTNYSMYDDDLVLMMNFDNVSALGEENNTFSHDASKYGNNGTCYDTDIGCNYTTGKYGRAIFFDGLTSYVDVGTPESLNLTESMSVSAWVNARAWPVDDADIVSKSDDTNGYVGWQLKTSIDTGPRVFAFGLSSDGGSANYVGMYGSTIADTDTWYYVVGVYNASEQTLHIYVDGVLNDNQTQGATIPSSQANSRARVQIGKRDGSLNPYKFIWNGTIDEVRIWNRSLSAAEIKQLYTSNLNKYDVDGWMFVSNQTNLSEGMYIYYALANDSFGYSNQTETRNMIISPNRVPAINFVTPTTGNNSFVSRTSTFVNVSVNDSNLGSAFIDWNRSLVLWTRFNNEAGENSTFVKDWSSYNNGGTYHGNSGHINYVQGIYGTAFNTSEDAADYITFPDNPQSVTSEFTIAAWIKATSTTPYGGVVRKVDGVGNDIYSFQMGVSSGIYYPEIYVNNGSQSIAVTAAYNISLNTWYYIVFTFNSTRLSGYYNGNLYNTIPNTIGNLSSSTLDIRIGCQSLGSACFNGSIDDVMIFNRVLSPAEINASYNTGLYRLENNFSNLVDGQYSYTAYVQDLAGNVNSTEERTLTVDTMMPSISFVKPTDDNNSYVSRNWSYVNVSTLDTNEKSTYLDIDNSIVSWFRMDDMNATDGILDFKGLNNGTIVGTVSQTSGILGNAMTFDGLNSYILVNDSLLPAGNSARTISVWFKKYNQVHNVSYGDEDTIVGYGSFNDNQYFGISTGYDHGLIICSHYATTPWFETGYITSDNVWYNVIATSDGINNISVYVNGNMIGSTIRVYNTTLSDLRIGSGQSSEGFNGSIDDVTIFNRSLSAAEALSIYTSGVNKYQRNITELSQGIHTYKAYVQDLAGNVNSTETRTLTVDTTTPSISFVSPTYGNNYLINDSSAYVNVSVYDSNLGSAFIDWNRSLVGWWRFNNEVGENSTFIKDWSTYGNNATCIIGSCPNYIMEGKFGGAYSYDGIDDYIITSNQNILDNATNFTVESWIYPLGQNSSNKQGFIVSKYEGMDGQRSWMLYVRNNSMLTITVYDNLSSANSANYANLPLNMWHHVVAVYNSTTIILYLDGVVVNIASWSQMPGVGGPIRVGDNQNAGSGSNPFNGTIDEVKIWNRVLSPEEINASYNAGLYRLEKNFTNLANGNYVYTAYVQDLAGNVNQTETRNIIINSNSAPAIDFSAPTPANNMNTTNTSVTINISINTTNLNTFIWNWNGTNLSMLDNDLILLMNFDNISALDENGTTVKDVSKYANNGTVVSAVYTQNGKYGGAYDFNENGEYIDIPDRPEFTYNNGFTWSLWMKPRKTIDENFTESYFFVMSQNLPGVNDGDMLLFWQHNYDGCNKYGQLSFELRSNPSNACSDNAVWNANEWYHITVTYNKSIVKMYVDGVLQSQTGYTIDQVPGNNSVNLRIGSHSASPYYSFNGTIDDVMIFNRSLSDSEVKQVYYSDLYKYSADSWNFYSKQSGLSVGNYSYYGYVKDSSGNVNQTETRILTINSVQCGNLTQANDVYTLTQNVSINGATCFNVQAENVTIDCAGYSLTGNNTDSTYGIFSNQSNTTVRNCKISNFSTAVYFYLSDRSSVWNSALSSTATGSSYEGRATSIRISNNVTFFNNTATATSYAVLAAVSANTVIANSVMTVTTIDSSQGVDLYQVTDALVENNTFFGKGGVLVEVNAHRALIRNNTINATGTYGVYIIGGSNVTVDCQGMRMVGTNVTGTYGVYSNQYNTTVKNCVISNFDTGIYFDGAVNGTILNNSVFASTNSYYTYTTFASAIFIYNHANYNTLMNNTVHSVYGPGIFLYNGCDYNKIINTSSISDSWGGIWITSSSYNIFSNSQFSGPDGTYGALAIYTDANNNIIANNTINGMSSSNALTIQGGHCTGNVLVNNTIVNATTLVYLDENASKNIFYWNNFTATSGLYVNDSDGFNYYNTTIGGVAAGNIWSNVINGSVVIYGKSPSIFSGLYYGAFGSRYPYNSTNSLGKLSGNVIDYGPLTSYTDTINPSINFTYPTTGNNYVVNISSTYVNISVNDSNLGSAFIDWNRSLVGWWRFNNEAGENSTFFKDYSTYGNNATCIIGSCPDYTMEGKFGGAYAFNSSHYVSAGNPSSLNFENRSFTYSIWVYPTSDIGTWDVPFSKGGYSPGEPGYDLELGSGNWGASIADGSQNRLVSFNRPSYNAWTLLTVVVDRESGNIYTYTNTNRSGNISIGTLGNVSNSYNAGFGEDTYLGLPYNGSIDEVKVWNRALSPEEINASYNAGLYRLEKNFTNLANGNYVYTAYVQDLAGNVNQTETRNITINSNSAPVINFFAPTPANNTVTTNTSVLINISMNTSSLNAFTFNWNGTNYSLYDNSVLLMMNFDNNSNIGDSATQATDVSLYSNNGTITNAAWSTTGVHGGSIRFNGAGDYITLPPSQIFYDILTPHATTFWIYINTYAGNGYPTILNLKATQGMYYAIYASNIGAYEGISITETSGTSFRAAGISGSLVGGWNHVAVVFDGVDRTQASSWKIYLNGVSQTVSAGGGWTVSASNILGTDDASAADTVNGNLDDLIIWNRSLTTSEIQQLYQSSLQKSYPDDWQYIVNESDLTVGNYSYYGFMNDSSGNSKQTETRYLTINSTITNPAITYVQSIISQDPVESGLKNLTINFTVYDASGNSSINISSARVVLSNNGVTRNSTSCSGSAINITSINVSCNVAMQYYDNPGTWNENISISNILNISTYNDSSSFTYNQLASIALSSSAINMGALVIGQQNITTVPLIINNTGNYNFSYISIKGYDLINSSSIINASNFKINTTNVAAGHLMMNNTFVNISNSQLYRSTDSIKYNTTIYIYVNIPNTTLVKGTYTSTSSWVVSAN